MVEKSEQNTETLYNVRMDLPHIFQYSDNTSAGETIQAINSLGKVAASAIKKLSKTNFSQDYKIKIQDSYGLSFSASLEVTVENGKVSSLNHVINKCEPKAGLIDMWAGQNLTGYNEENYKLHINIKTANNTPNVRLEAEVSKNHSDRLYKYTFFNDGLVSTSKSSEEESKITFSKAENGETLVILEKKRFRGFQEKISKSVDAAMLKEIRSHYPEPVQSQIQETKRR